MSQKWLPVVAIVVARYNNKCYQLCTYTCSCRAGWTGWLCDTDLDECLSSPCLNGGFCRQTAAPGNYTCACMDEYEGHDCEELKVSRVWTGQSKLESRVSKQAFS